MLKSDRPGLYLIFAAILLAMLAVGLNPRGYPFRNDAYAGEPASELRFRGHGIAHSEPFALAPDAQAVSLVLALRTAEGAALRGFQAIATLSSGTPENQLLIAQWRHQLTVMTGDDYAYRNREPRLTTAIEDGSIDSVLLALVLNDGEAALYLDGRLAASRGSGISLPDDGLPVTLILGNSADGTLPWHGSVFAVALYSRALSALEAAEFASHWKTAPRTWRFPAEGAELLYDRSDFSGPSVDDRSGNARHLLIPRYRAFVDPTFPVWRVRSTSLSDLLVNLFGFLPFGYLLAACMARERGTLPVLSMLLIVGAGGVLFSALIEITQAWIPTRTASLLDVLLNGSGAILGAGLWVALQRVSGPAP